MLIHENPMYHLPFLPFAMAEVTPVVVGAMRGRRTPSSTAPVNGREP